MVHRNTLVSLETFQTLCQLQHAIVLAKLDAKAGMNYRIAATSGDFRCIVQFFDPKGAFMGTYQELKATQDGPYRFLVFAEEANATGAFVIRVSP